MLPDGRSGPTGPRCVVFVCEGNTCRSPLAEVLARDMFGGIAACFASAGLAARTGDVAHPNAVAAAAERGLDLRGHRARPLGAVSLAETAWLIAMDRGQAARLRAFGPACGPAIGVLGAPGLDVRAAGGTAACEEVPDPWGGDLECYQQLASRLARLLVPWGPYLAAGPSEGEGA